MTNPNPNEYASAAPRMERLAREQKKLAEGNQSEFRIKSSRRPLVPHNLRVDDPLLAAGALAHAASGNGCGY
jgi:hypothetical protein